eukprot:Nk52_evm83s224 gene=Nk52_evmTU83s224
MNSIGEHCTELKKKYDKCFNQWYSEKFLKGETASHCDAFFKEYQACVMETIKKNNILEGIEQLDKEEREEKEKMESEKAKK